MFCTEITELIKKSLKLISSVAREQKGTTFSPVEKTWFELYEDSSPKCWVAREEKKSEVPGLGDKVARMDFLGLLRLRIFHEISYQITFVCAPLRSKIIPHSVRIIFFAGY